MSVYVIAWVMDKSEQTLGRRLVLLALAEGANHDGTGAWPSVPKLAKMTRLSERQVRRCLRDLEEDGAIEKTGEKSRGVGIYNVLMTPDNLSGDNLSTPDIYDTSPRTSTTVPHAGASDISLRANTEPSNEPSVGELVAEVFAHWAQAMGHPKAILDSGRVSAIRRALKNYSVEDCKRAIDGCAASDYHMRRGEYASRAGGVYDGLDLIFRNAEKTEDFISRAPSPSQAARGPMTQEARVAFARATIKAKEAVRRGWEHRANPSWREKGDEAAAWLRDNGYSVTYDEQNLNPPTIKEITE